MTDRLLALLPWAFTAGAFATANPCGFAMLPAYLSYYVTGAAEQPSVESGPLNGIRVGLVMTTGVLSVFLLAGGAVSALGTGIARFLPVINLAIGAVIVGLGTLLLVRPSFTLVGPVGNPLAARPQIVEGRRVQTFFVFGAGYGIASLGCTLPIFLGGDGSGAGRWRVPLRLAGFPRLRVGDGQRASGTLYRRGDGPRGSGQFASPDRTVREAPWRIGMVAAGGYLIYYQATAGRMLLFGR